ncbi:hypothetical protein [Salinispora arenicola]|uniref:hypothetical protein n=1 Tax=Salinispora arenicola TaxID=168697 RepID=UPI0016B3B031|nr:hypothetical protein [Salinispora arenicola]NIL64858.1 hypothetical protein [Salinispora arenicola]
MIPRLHPQSDIDGSAVDVGTSRLAADDQLHEFDQPGIDPLPGHDGRSDVIESDRRIGR